MSDHTMTEPHQIRHPGGKDGWWQVECTNADCEYVTQGYTVERATAKFRDHLDGIAQRQRTYYPTPEQVREEAERLFKRAFTPLQRAALRVIQADAWREGQESYGDDPNPYA